MRRVESLTDADIVVGWSADSRFWKEIAPPNRTGILFVRPNFITDNQQSYAYTTYQQVSTLFVTE